MAEPNAVGERVRRFRRALKLTQHELARRAGITQPFVSQIERGEVAGPLRPRTLIGLADGLGLDVAALVGDDPSYDLLELDEPPSWSSSLSGLPAPTRALVGRDDALAAITTLLNTATVRLLTLTGPGGVGKTHLALGALAAFDERAFPAGVTVVSLAFCVDAAQVVSAVAHALSLRERDVRPLRRRVFEALRSGRRLLLFDNLEQTLPSASDLVADLLADCPELRLLVTSRVPLRLRDEREFPVQPLRLPDPVAEPTLAVVAASPAVQLFVERARAVLPDFSLSTSNMVEVTAVCRRLDGLPLAIELAAPRLKLCALDELLRRLDHLLNFLTTGARDLPQRQQTLRSTIAWSEALSSQRAQELFRRLAVFNGGFTLAAADSVAGDSRPGDGVEAARPTTNGGSLATDELVAELVDQSLLRRVAGPLGTARFGMLETVREYAAERLAASGEIEDVNERHLVWCLTLAEQAEPNLYTATEPIWLRRLDDEYENFRAALAWAFAQGHAAHRETGLRLAAALTDYWYLTGRLSDGRSWLDRAVAVSESDPASFGRTRALVGLSEIEQAQNEIGPAVSHGEAGLKLARRLGDVRTTARALTMLGNVAFMSDDLVQARSLHSEALVLFRQVGDQPWIAVELINLGLVAYKEQNLGLAAANVEAALAIAREIGDDFDAGIALRMLGDVARERGELQEAAARLAESLALLRQRGSWWEIADCLAAYGSLAVASGDFTRAAWFLAVATTLYQRVGYGWPPTSRPDWSRTEVLIRAALGEDQVDRLREAAGALAPEQAISEVLAIGLVHPTD